MRIVFMGTPAFAADILQGLIESHHEVVGCFPRPDAVRGRGKKLVYSPVKERAVQAGIPVYEFSSMKSDEAFGALASLRPDAVCVAAYGAILPKRVLELPRFGCLNVHGSLLPRWRGAVGLACGTNPCKAAYGQHPCCPLFCNPHKSLLPTPQPPFL